MARPIGLIGAPSSVGAYAPCLDSGAVALVLGGDCTVGLGTVAGHLPAEERIGLLYFDIHADLNTPHSVPDGALDWMGVAHLLGEEDATAELSRFGPRYPLLNPDHGAADGSTLADFAERLVRALASTPTLR